MDPHCILETPLLHTENPFLVLQLLMHPDLDIYQYVKVSFKHEKMLFVPFHYAYYLHDVKTVTNPILHSLWLQIHDNILKKLEYNLELLEELIEYERDKFHWTNIPYQFEQIIVHYKQTHEPDLTDLFIE